LESLLLLVKVHLVLLVERSQLGDLLLDFLLILGLGGGGEALGELVDLLSSGRHGLVDGD
jgi:hypothetical protein